MTEAADAHDTMVEAGTVDLAVVMPAYNAAATIRAQLDALVSQCWSGTWEVVVVDNGSSDATRDIVDEYAARDPRFRLVVADARHRIGYVRNAGIAAARGYAIAMCDADDVVQPGWVAAIGNALRDHEFVAGALDVHILNEPALVETRGLAIEREAATFLGVFPVAHSCNVAMQRALIDRIGGFSEEFVNGSDVELSHRVWRDGTAMFYATDALVAYRYRTTPLGLARQARNYGKVNAALVATFRAAGTEIPTSGDLRGWIWLMRKLPLLTTRAGRARWMWAAGTRVGRLEGRLRRDAAFLGDHVHRAR